MPPRAPEQCALLDARPLRLALIPRPANAGLLVVAWAPGRPGPRALPLGASRWRPAAPTEACQLEHRRHKSLPKQRQLRASCKPKGRAPLMLTLGVANAARTPLASSQATSCVRAFAKLGWTSGGGGGGASAKQRPGAAQAGGCAFSPMARARSPGCCQAQRHCVRVCARMRNSALADPGGCWRSGAAKAGAARLAPSARYPTGGAARWPGPGERGRAIVPALLPARPIVRRPLAAARRRPLLRSGRAGARSDSPVLGAGGTTRAETKITMPHLAFGAAGLSTP